MLFVIIARRREVEEEPSARAHLLFPLTPSDRDTKSADSKRRKKRKRQRYSISGSLSLSLSERRLCEKRNLWWPLQNPFPPFRKTYPHNVSSFEPQRRCVFFRERERERVKRERKHTQFFFLAYFFFLSKCSQKKTKQNANDFCLGV